MPITQSRMLALIAAAEELQQGLESITDSYKLSRERIRRGEITPAEAFSEFALTLDQKLLLPNIERTYATVAVESAHFSRAQGRNAKSAARQAVKRGGVPSGTTAPKSLIPIREERLRAKDLAIAAPREETEDDKLMREMGIKPGSHPDLDAIVSSQVTQQGEELGEDFSGELSADGENP